MMLRTQIYLPEEDLYKLAIIARNLNKSRAFIVRKILKKALEDKQLLACTGKDLLSLAKLKFRSGPKDLSARFDEYLYG